MHDSMARESSARAAVDDGSATPARRRTTLTLAAMLCASVALAWTVFAVPYVPTSDGPQHILTGYIENHFDDAGVIYPSLLEPAPQFAARGFATIFVPCERLFGWRLAYRLTVAFSLLAFAWAFAALVHSLAPRRLYLSLLGFACAWQWSLYLGFFSYAIGGALGMLVLACALSGRLTRPRLTIIALALLLQAFLHVFSAILTGLVLLALALAEGETRRARLLALAKIALAGLPAALLLVAALADAPSAMRIEDAGHFVFFPLLEKLRYLPRCFLPGARFRGDAVAALALVGLGRAFREISDTGSDENRLRGRRERALAIAAAMLLLASIFGPFTVPGWQLVFPRFLPLGLMLPLCLLDVERLPRRPAIAAAAAVSLFSMASIAAAADLNLGLYKKCADAVSGLDLPLHRQKLRLPVIRDAWSALSPQQNPVPFMVPLRAIGSLYAVAQGGMSTYPFVGTPAEHAFTAKDEAWDAFPRVSPFALQDVAHLRPGDPQRRAVVDGYAAVGSVRAYYDDVILYADPADADQFRARGYVEDYRRGDLWIGHFEGCRAELQVAPHPGFHGVSYGYAPQGVTTGSRAIDESAGGNDTHSGNAQSLGADGLLHIKLSDAPCGAAWFSFVTDGATCRGADARGRVFAQVQASGETIVKCDW